MSDSINETTGYVITDTLIGSGSFAEVRLAKKSSEVGFAAVKIVKIFDEYDRMAITNEINILLRLAPHDNIVRLLGHFYEEVENYQNAYLIMEYMEGGDLFDKIQCKNFYSEKCARDIMHSVLVAIKRCHDMQVVHRDIKPENLLFERKSDEAILKLADFGTAVVLIENNLLADKVGTPQYMAPEICSKKKYSYAVDLWSAGVVLYVMLFGQPPFDNPKPSILYKDIIKGHYSVPDGFGISNEALDLMHSLLTVDPSKRLTVDQALAHVWLHSDDLHSRDLSRSAQELRRYRARQHFRSTVKAVMAANLFRRMGEHYRIAHLENQATSALLPTATSAIILPTATTSNVAETSSANQDNGDQVEKDGYQAGNGNDLHDLHEDVERVGGKSEALDHEESNAGSTLTSKSRSCLSLGIPFTSFSSSDCSELMSPPSSLGSGLLLERRPSSLTDPDSSIIKINNTTATPAVLMDGDKSHHKRGFDSIACEGDHEDDVKEKRLKEGEVGEEMKIKKKETTRFGCIWG
eukprot:CAMPEP_0201098574 /NCGR_PEP_ID=MMETSP0812-20130820/7620_1 /ASSEMBLY_ACC=CAM_ASM_000668 /TAXON_ID=98059 /ORGANISM="Dinobryon sp., Strain UTEXLB2267" /LENGTH=521 /DNA_ID=CAMNT_0047354073 /DNA_START=670 /DNA_END=2235 /DNA_ORIENTATION=-